MRKHKHIPKTATVKVGDKVCKYSGELAGTVASSIISTEFDYRHCFITYGVKGKVMPTGTIKNINQ